MMFKTILLIVASAAAVLAMPAYAQDLGQQEVMLSPSQPKRSGRAQTSNYDPKIPAIGLIRTADFAVRSVTIEGDSRERELRESEIQAMLEKTIKAAETRGIELSFGSTAIESLNLDNFAGFANRNVLGGSRPDTSRISFLIKVPLSDSSHLQAVTKKMDDFQDAVKPVGRAQFAGKGPITLSIKKPDQYRSNIIDLIGEDSRTVAAQIGEDFSVSISGLQKPVDWVRWNDLQILLFVPYETVVVPSRQN